jgi:hypothetical protein
MQNQTHQGLTFIPPDGPKCFVNLLLSEVLCEFTTLGMVVVADELKGLRATNNCLHELVPAHKGYSSGTSRMYVILFCRDAESSPGHETGV